MHNARSTLGSLRAEVRLSMQLDSGPSRVACSEEVGIFYPNRTFERPVPCPVPANPLITLL